MSKIYPKAQNNPIVIGIVGNCDPNIYLNFFSGMPTSTGLAFVVLIQGNSTHCKSLEKSLRDNTLIPVCSAEDELAVKADHIYIADPRKYLKLSNSKLRVTFEDNKHGPIDHFFESIAKQMGHNTIGVILSDTNGDGYRGLKAIKEQGGISLAAGSKEMDFVSDSSLGLLDMIAPIEKLAQKILQYLHCKSAADTSRIASDPDFMNKLITDSHHDFSVYKKNIVVHRLVQRMAFKNCTEPSTYAKILKQSKPEVESLFQSIQTVPGNFRFENNTTELIIDTLTSRVLDNSKPLRVWVVNCCTGEQAYTAAILCHEAYHRAKLKPTMKIFATDSNTAALNFARAGLFPSSIEIPSDLLGKYFFRIDEKLRVKSELRDSIIFAPHNPMTDAPYSNLDLIWVQPVPDYLNSNSKYRLLQSLHFALRSNGLLLWQRKKQQMSEGFQAILDSSTLFRRTGIKTSGRFFPTKTLRPGHHNKTAMKPKDILQSAILKKLAPACVLVNREQKVLYFHGNVHDYLSQPDGTPEINLITLARHGLKAKLRSTLNSAITDDQPSQATAYRVRRKNRNVSVALNVTPLADGLFLVSFQDNPAPGIIRNPGIGDENELIQKLKQDLLKIQSEWQQTIEELETSNDIIKSSDSELVAINEELQLSNEELETSREELQLLNQDLKNINQQLHDKVSELETTNTDLINLFKSTDVATIFLDKQGKINRFTPATGNITKLIKTDIGRPIDNIADPLLQEGLVNDINQIDKTNITIHREIQAKSKRWYIRRILPYLMTDGQTNGTVITFSDITNLKISQMETRINLELLEKVFDSVRVMIAYLDNNFNFIKVNRNYALNHGKDIDYFRGKNHFKLFPEEHNEAIFNQVLKSGGPYYNESSLLKQQKKESKQTLYWDWALQPVFGNDNNVIGLVLSLVDVSDRERTQIALNLKEQHLSQSLKAAHAGAWNWEPASNLMDWSDEVYNLYGVKPGSIEPSMRNWLKLIHPEDRDRVRRLMEDAHETGQEVSCDYRIQRPSGEIRHLSKRAAILGDPQKKRMLGILIDVTEKRKIEQNLTLFARVFQSSIEGILITDQVYRTVAVNDAFLRISGKSRQNLLGHEPDFFDETKSLFEPEILDTIAKLGHWKGEKSITLPDGNNNVSWITISSVESLNNGNRHYIIVLTDITDRKKAEQRVQQLAHFDSLTGLANRALLYDKLAQALASVSRHHNKIALLFIDLDRFKNINDTLGHSFGDKLLRAVAHRLKANIRREDTIARIGGDEFVIILHTFSDVAQVTSMADKLLAELKKPIILYRREYTLTASIGITISPDDGLDVDTLLQNADLAMYHVKTKTGGSWQFYAEEMNTRAHNELTIETGVQRALKENSFVLLFQPQIDLHSGKLVAMEALIRWKEGKTLIPPSQFLSIACDRGLIASIDNWVIREACRQQRKWRLHGYETVPIAINLSAHSIRRADFSDGFFDIIQDHGLQTSDFEIELLENAIFENVSEVTTVLHQLSHAGLRLAIDDFGTGYSSLSYLSRFPIDKIKIDRSFIANMDKTSNDSAIVTAIISLAKSLGIKVVAEGIETQAQIDFVRENHCDVVQGFYFSPPKTANEIARQLKIESQQTPMSSKKKPSKSKLVSNPHI